MLVVPFKWLLRSHAQPVDAAASACRRTWWQRFQNHLQQCIFDHPTVKAAAFLWTGKLVAGERGVGFDEQGWQMASRKLRAVVGVCHGVQQTPVFQDT